MPGQKVVWGIDVGQFALRGLKLRLQGDAAEVVAFDVVEYPQILSQPEANADQLLAEAVEKFVGRNELRGSEVVLGVPGQQTFTRFSKLPPVEQKKISSIVAYEAQQQIPFDMDEVIWDYQVFSTPDTPEVEVGIFAIRRDLVRKYLSVFTDRGIEPVLVQASPLALYNYLAFDDMPNDGAVVILDVGAQNTDLVVARKDGAWTRNIPLGGNNFTEALVKSFKLSFGKAEALKRTAASSRYARQIFQAMRPVFADLVAEIQRSLGYYNSTHRDVQMSKIIGMGNAFKLPGLQKYLQQNLQTEVDRLAGFKKLQVGQGLNAAAFNEGAMSMGVAYGLAAQGLGVGKINNSLLPMEIARSMVWRRKAPWFAGAAGIILAGALTVGYSRTRYASALAATAGPGNYSPTVASVEAANDVIMKGASDAPTGRMKAEKIANATLKLKSAMDAEKAAGEKPTGLAQIVDAIKDRTFWIELLAKIHETAPKPPEVLAAKTTDEYVAALKKIPRAQRQMVYVDSIDAGYVSDTGMAFASGSVSSGGSGPGGGRGEDPSRGGGRMSFGGGAAGGAAPAGGEVSSGPRGFILIIKGHTPYSADGQGKTVVFLSEWAKRLKAITGDHVQFRVVKIDERPEAMPIGGQGTGGVALSASWVPPISSLASRSNRTALTLGGSSSSSGSGGLAPSGPVADRGEGPIADRGEDPSAGGRMSFGRGRRAAPRPEAGASAVSTTPGSGTNPQLDPLTNEMVSSDFAFTIRMTVVLNQGQDASAAAPSEAPTAAPSPAPAAAPQPARVAAPPPAPSGAPSQPPGSKPARRAVLR